MLWNLWGDSLRFSEIKKRLSLGAVGTKGVAPRVLGRELRTLADFGLVYRRAYDVVPPKVEYRLTPLGRTLLPIITEIITWGVRHPIGRSHILQTELPETANPGSI